MNIIWSKNNCIYCKRAKELFEYRDVEYEERNIDTENWTLQQLKTEVPEAKRLPQIFMGKLHIGGYQELITHFALGNIKL